MTQVEAAERLGRTQAWVSKCELGERRVDFVEVSDFARAYGVGFEFFDLGAGTES